MQEPSRQTVELAAVWCSIMASDRATSCWTIKLHNPEQGSKALQLAWRTRQYAVRVQLNRHRRNKFPLTAAELWAEAECRLRWRLRREGR